LAGLVANRWQCGTLKPHPSPSQFRRLTMPEWVSDRSALGDTHVCREIGLPPSNRYGKINSHTQEVLAMNCSLITACVFPL